MTDRMYDRTWYMWNYMRQWFPHLLAEQERQAGAPAPRPAFKVTPSCPPDLQFHVRGGWLGYSPAGAAAPGDRWYIEPQAIDLADDDTFSTLTTFTTARYYKLVVIGYQHDVHEPNPGVNWYGGDAEFATAGEAEGNMDAMWAWWWPWLDSYTLVALVVRNNGVVGVSQQIEPIASVNRGGSYIWMDVRPPADFIG